MATLVVMGGKDQAFPDPAAEAVVIAEALGATVAMVPDAGHHPQSEFPEVSGPAVMDFVCAPSYYPARGQPERQCT